MIKINTTYHLVREQNGKTEHCYFIRRPFGGYALSKEKYENFLEYQDYWEEALKKLQQEGYALNEQDTIERRVTPEEFPVLYESYRTKKKYLYWLFLLFLIMYVSSYALGFLRLHYVDTIAPEVLTEPVQKELRQSDPILFTREGYHFELTPRYSYELSGLLVHTFSYDTWYSIDKKDKVIPIDLCIIWGDNVRSGVFKDWNSRFSQDQRFCWWHGSQPIKNDQISNNHLVVKSDEFEKKLNNLQVGDQIRLVGKLVDIKATPLKSGEGYANGVTTFTTSTIRQDTGAGACEVIYLEDIQVLHKDYGPLEQARKTAINGLLVVIILRVLIKILFEYRKKRMLAAS